MEIRPTSMRWMLTRSSLALCALLLGSCAGYCIEDEARGTQGYVVYEPWPYVVQTATAYKNGSLGGYRFEVVYLPNRARPYRITSWSGFGKADFEFDFENGWMLRGVHDRGDNTGLVEALAGLLPEAPALEVAPDGGLPPPVLYRVEFDAGGHVSGLAPVAFTSHALLRDAAVPGADAPEHRDGEEAR